MLAIKFSFGVASDIWSKILLNSKSVGAELHNFPPMLFNALQRHLAIAPLLTQDIPGLIAFASLQLNRHLKTRRAFMKEHGVPDTVPNRAHYHFDVTSPLTRVSSILKGGSKDAE